MIGTRLSHTLAIAGALALTLVSAPGWAGYVTQAELTDLQTGMNTIYSQAGFGANDIQIRFNAIETVTGPTSINALADLNALQALDTDASPTVNAFFVDSINWCGTTGDTIVGCAFRPGFELFLDSNYVDSDPSGDGATDFSHELGHNLGLAHLAGTNTNLMNPVLGSTVLTAGQITTILASGLVQTDFGGQKYILITPIQVVPVPPALGLMVSGLAALGLRMRRKAA